MPTQKRGDPRQKHLKNERVVSRFFNSAYANKQTNTLISHKIKVYLDSAARLHFCLVLESALLRASSIYVRLDAFPVLGLMNGCVRFSLGYPNRWRRKTFKNHWLSHTLASLVHGNRTPPSPVSKPVIGGGKEAFPSLSHVAL